MQDGSAESRRVQRRLLERCRAVTLVNQSFATGDPKAKLSFDRAAYKTHIKDIWREAAMVGRVSTRRRAGCDDGRNARAGTVPFLPACGGLFASSVVCVWSGCRNRSRNRSRGRSWGIAPEASGQSAGGVAGAACSDVPRTSRTLSLANQLEVTLPISKLPILSLSPPTNHNSAKTIQRLQHA